MTQINFFKEDIYFSTRPLIPTKKWIKSIIEKEEKQCGQINFVFCSDKYLLQINIDYLDHDTYTDIITFDQSENEDEISGDIYISLERVKENAIEQNTNEFEEIKRVMIHGVLHLVGYGDKTKDEATLMREKEDEALSLWHR